MGAVREEEAETAVVGAYGALVLLAKPLSVGQSIQVTNLRTGSTSWARVVWDGGFTEEGQARVGIELSLPNYRFWGVWILSLGWIVAGLFASLSAITAAALVLQEGLSAFREEDYLVGISSLVIGAFFLAYFVTWILQLVHRSPERPEVSPD